MSPVPMGDDRRNRKRRNGVAGWKAAVRANRRAFAVEPRIPIIAVRGEIGRALSSIDNLENRCYDLSIGHSFAGEQGRVLHLAVFPDQADSVKRYRRYDGAYRGRIACEYVVEPVKSRGIVKIPGFGWIQSKERSSCGSDGDSRNPGVVLR